MHAIKHFITITRHRHAVMKYCFKVGLIWQGLTHDLSKYGITEFWRGAKYYQGNCSPQMKEREVEGYSTAWLHHKGRNKHHYEYWTDGKRGVIIAVEMPKKYFAEMVCDRIAASKVYKGKDYTDSCALEYFQSRNDKASMNEKTARNLEYFLTLLAEKGEEVMFKQLRAFIKNNK